MSDVRLVIFDVDGTLVDSQADIVMCMDRAFAAQGLDTPGRADILGIVGLSLPEAMGQLAPGLPTDDRRALVAAYKEAYAAAREAKGADATSPLYPHVRGVLESLHSRPEVLLGLATGKSRRGLDFLLEAHDLRALFVTRQCADDHPSKPHPAMLRAALSEAAVAPHQAVMIGDTSYDMDMARAAGLLAIGVSWGYHEPARLADAHIVIDDIRLLPGLLDQIRGQS